MNKIFNAKFLRILIVLAGIFLIISFMNSSNNKKEGSGAINNKISYSLFMEKVNQKELTSVKIDSVKGTVLAKNESGDQYLVNAPVDSNLLNKLENNVKSVEILSQPEESKIGTFLLYFGPVLLLIAFFIYSSRSKKGGGLGGDFGKSKAKKFMPSENNVRFSAVQGCDEAKEEVAEIVDFLKNPSKYEKLGARQPAGILMSGPPGTGKTLLAKAIAGEAGVPFYSTSGSEFVEMFVGVGASRVRAMFEEAKKNSPSIIFIDEIDAIGRKRGVSPGGGNEEREQTLNQMLVEMDGFGKNEGVIVIAATNRPEMLDDALRRPGRFDREVVVSLPDVKGRENILKNYARSVVISKDVSMNTIARGATGFSGADLENLVNEAALLASRNNKDSVEMIDFEEAKDKIIMGFKREKAIIPEEQRVVTAWHEAGHAIISLYMEHNIPLHKVTIIPRGRAMGVTMQLEKTDRYGYTHEEFLANISMLFGGRLAEEIFLQSVSTGASNDIERANAIARDMVTKYGMSKLGMIHCGDMSGNGFRGSNSGGETSVSSEMMKFIDIEVQNILEQQYIKARDLLIERKMEMKLLSEALLEKETLDIHEIRLLLGIEEEKEENEELSTKKKGFVVNLDNLKLPKWGGLKELLSGSNPSEVNDVKIVNE